MDIGQHLDRGLEQQLQQERDDDRHEDLAGDVQRIHQQKAEDPGQQHRLDVGRELHRRALRAFVCDTVRHLRSLGTGPRGNGEGVLGLHRHKSSPPWDSRRIPGIADQPSHRASA